VAGQLITAGGEQFVLLPLAEYERLTKAAKTLVVGLSEPVPARPYSGEPAVSQNGESALRIWRKHRGFVLEKLAKEVGISKSFLSEIETGKRFGKPIVWSKLAKVLNTDIEAILPQDQD